MTFQSGAEPGPRKNANRLDLPTYDLVGREPGGQPTVTTRSVVGLAGLAGHEEIADKWVVELRPLMPGDTSTIYRAAVSDELGLTWRYRGRPVSPERFQRELYEGVLHHKMIIGRWDHRELGYCVVYNYRAEARVAYLGLLRVDTPGGYGMVQGAIQMLREVFDRWGLTKIYLEVPGFNYGRLVAADGWLVKEEGRLREFDYHLARLWDLHILSISRGVFDEFWSSISPGDWP